MLTGLRALDRHVVVVWMRRGAWLLGSYLPNRIRIEGARSTLHKLHATGAPAIHTTRERYRKAIIAWGNREALTRLRAQGVVEHKAFEVSEYSEDVIWGQMELWLRAAVWTRQHHYEAYWRAMDHAQGQHDEAERKLADMLDSARLKEAYRMGFKNPVSRGWTKSLDTSLSLQTA